MKTPYQTEADSALTARQFEEIMSRLLDKKSDEVLHNNSLHDTHHLWIEHRIQADKAKAEFYQSVTRIVLQWSIPALLAGIYYYMQHGVWPVK